MIDTQMNAGHKHQGLLAAKPFTSHAPSSEGYGQQSGGGGQSRKNQGMTAVKKPWADQPWPLIDMPLMTHHISHPALNIANQMAHIHNAMIRGLNAIYLQAPHVQQTQDVADLLFLTQSWSTWLLDHHELKEGTMLPGFEAVLGVPAGTLTLPRRRSPPATSYPDGGLSMTTRERNGQGKDTYGREGAGEETISFLLYRVYAYASVTHEDAHAYSAAALRALLFSLAEKLVPHLTAQIGLLASMREMCFDAPYGTKTQRDDEIPGPPPVPIVTIPRTPSHTSPSTPSPSSPSPSAPKASAASASTSLPAQSPPRVTFSLFPATSPPKKSIKANANAKAKNNNANVESNNKRTKQHASSKSRNLDMIQKEAQSRALKEATLRGANLTKTYLAAETQVTASADRFVVPPMIVRLRDVTFSSSSPCASSSASLCSSSGRSSHSGRARTSTRRASDYGSGTGNGSVGEWPWLSVPAVHAIADRLSGRHEGAWRFLPCDVWGRPRELRFMG